MFKDMRITFSMDGELNMNCAQTSCVVVAIYLNHMFVSVVS
jgi:hypothetical protein